MVRKHGVRRLSLAVVFAMLLSLFGAGTQPALAADSVSLSTLGGLYSQDFNLLASSGTSSAVPTGWALSESSTNANSTYSAGTGSSNAGDTYSFGSTSSTERAFGGLRSGNLVPIVGASFVNNTGATITSLAISYTGEQWRAGVENRNAADRLDFQYSTSTTALNSGTWTDVNTLDFNSPNTNAAIGPLVGNNGGNRTTVSTTVSGLSIANGATFWIRWTDFNISDADDGLAVDDFTLIPFGVVADSAPTVSSTSPSGDATDVTVTSNITVTFSEAVNASSSSFSLVCSTSGTKTFTLSGGPTTFTLDPSTDFANGESCTLNVIAAQVSDQDANDPPDNMTANYVTRFTTIGPDNAPEVASTVPVDDATNVPLNQNITVNFSEPVNVTDPWFSLTCATSGAHPAAVTGGPTNFTLNPTTDFVYGEECTLVIDGGKVRDQDSNDPPDTMVLNFTAGFTTEADPCTVAYTRAYQIQGSGAAAAITGNVTTQGVVVGDYEGASPALRGFYLQDINGDGDTATSDAIFVFNANNNNVGIGDIVRVTGTAGENQDQTQINNVTSLRKCGTGTVSPVDVTLPFSSATEAEQYEGMLVRMPQTLYVTEHFQLGRFGQVVLSSGGRLAQPTNIFPAGPEAAALQAQNNLNRIIVDDASQGQNPDPILFGRGGQPLSASNTLRGGDTATGIVGVMTYTWAGNVASGNAYRVRPINALGATMSNFQPVNPRPTSPPAVGGTLKVASFNVLNYFVTVDPNTSDSDSFTADNVCGPLKNQECRGADNTADNPSTASTAERTRQENKMIQALLKLDTDVYGLIELENTDGVDPLARIVSLLNAKAGAGTFAYVNTGTIGGDAIKVGIIYKPNSVTPVGAYQTIDENDDPRFNTSRNRPALAQTFEEPNGGRFTMVVNHLKSKGSGCGTSDPDTGDGQGNCNLTRKAAAEALVDWLTTDPTGSSDPDFLLLGDLNSYAREDPMLALEEGGFTNLVSAFEGPSAYSYAFDGQWGSLDHAMASEDLVAQVTGAKDYHINADEPSVLDYNSEFKSAGQQSSLYAADEFRTSDHDPVVIGLELNVAPTVDAGGPYTVAEGSSVTLNAAGRDSTYADNLQYAWDFDGDGQFDDATGATPSFSAAALDGPTSLTVKVQMTDDLGLTGTDTATLNVTNVAPTVAPSFSAASAGCGVASVLSGTVSDPAAADTFTAVVNWGDGSAVESVTVSNRAFSASHTYVKAGTYTATVTVTDDDGGSETKTATTAVNYTVVGGGVLQPVKDGSSVFKYGSTIPVKVKLQDCDGSYPDKLAPTIKLTQLSGNTPVGEINEPASTSSADTTGVLRYDAANQQYSYNLATKSLPDSTATYQITITVPMTGQTVTATFGLK